MAGRKEPAAMLAHLTDEQPTLDEPVGLDVAAVVPTRDDQGVGAGR